MILRFLPGYSANIDIVVDEVGEFVNKSLDSSSRSTQAVVHERSKSKACLVFIGLSSPKTTSLKESDTSEIYKVK